MLPVFFWQYQKKLSISRILERYRGGRRKDGEEEKGHS